MQKRKRLRLIGFDYGTPGAYFITSVVKDRAVVFGEIQNGRCVLNRYGQIIADQWNWLHNRYAYLALDKFVVMPNHFHGIIAIGSGGEGPSAGNGRDRSLHRSSDRPGNIKTVSELIGAFKTRSSKLIHDAGLRSFQWQKSFYDRVIRNERELNAIREYIETNPLRWELDVENAGNAVVGNGRDRSLREQSARIYYSKIIGGESPASVRRGPEKN